MSPEFKHFERPTSQRPSSLVSVVAVSAVVGLAMGAAGYSLMKTLYPPDTLIYGGNSGGFTISRKLLDEPLAGLAAQLDNFVGTLYRQDSTASLFLDTNVAGSVAVVTSDGWFLYPGDARLGVTSILFNRKLHAVTDVRYDARLGLSFVKVEATNLVPLVFYREGYPVVGSLAVSYLKLPGSSSIMRRSLVERSNYVSRATRAALTASSADIRGDVEFADQEKNSLLFNAQGQLLAAVSDNNRSVPSYYIEQSLLAALSGRQPAILGILYRETYREPLTVETEKGIVVTARPLSTTPAGRAGLLENDRILSVDNKDLSLDYTFPQAQARYYTGDIARLKVQRGEQILDLEVSF